MTVETKTYVKKPLYVQAVQITEDNFDAVATWCGGEVLRDDVPGVGSGPRYIKVQVHNPRNARQTKAYVGDWMLRTERGFKIYSNKNFLENFDLVAVLERAG